MRVPRLLALVSALALGVLATTGAAIPPQSTVTYHGTFTNGVVLPDSGGGCVLDAGTDISGEWVVQVPDQHGQLAWVTVHIKYNNRPHAVWKMPFTLNSWTPSAVSAENFLDFGGPQPDHLTVNLAGGTFTYRLDSSALLCHIEFTGPQLP